MTLGPDDDALAVVRAADLDDGDTLPRWLVDTLWARSAVGVLGGAPSPASPGLPSISRSPSPRAHPASMCSASTIRDSAVPARSIWPAHRSTSSRRRCFALIAAATRPACASPSASSHHGCSCSTPFVRLARVDENDAGEVFALLGYLRALQHQHDVAVLVVHHARNNGGAGTQAGLLLHGSGDFHAWGIQISTSADRRTPCCSPSSMGAALS